MTAEPRQAAVLGHPVAHSLSPLLHRAAYRALGLDDWTYGLHDVTEEQLPGVVRALDTSWAGLSLTMPLKQAVLPLLDHVDPLAKVVGAVNTVVVQGGGASPVLVGANTDVAGIVAALREGAAVGARAGAGLGLGLGLGAAAGAGPGLGAAAGAGPGAAEPGALPEHPSAVVLGAGATAAAALAALAELGCTTPVVHARSVGRAGALSLAAHRMGVEPALMPLTQARDTLPHADLVVSTMPAHGGDDVAAVLTGPVKPGAVLLDVAYEERHPALVRAWEAAGGIAVTGERMLLHQAVEQVRMMTGLPGPLDAMDAALRARGA